MSAHSTRPRDVFVVHVSMNSCDFASVTAAFCFASSAFCCVGRGLRAGLLELEVDEVIEQLLALLVRRRLVARTDREPGRDEASAS